MTALVTGAPGNVGTPLVGELLDAGAPVRAAAVRPDRAAEAFAGMAAGGHVEVVRFDFTDPASWPAAFAGWSGCSCSACPSSPGSAETCSRPSTRPPGAPPGRRGPPALLADGLDLRPGRLLHGEPVHTHAPEIRERDELWVPAGKGRTALWPPATWPRWPPAPSPNRATRAPPTPRPAGRAAGLTDDVRALTGRTPFGFRSVARDHADAWRPAVPSSAG